MSLMRLVATVIIAAAVIAFTIWFVFFLDKKSKENGLEQNEKEYEG